LLCRSGGEQLAGALLTDEFKGRLALVSSFGTEAALLIDMVAAIDPTVPIIFVDTGKMFGETLRYRVPCAFATGLPICGRRIRHPTASTNSTPRARCGRETRTPVARCAGGPVRQGAPTLSRPDQRPQN